MVGLRGGSSEKRGYRNTSLLWFEMKEEELVGVE